MRRQFLAGSLALTASALIGCEDKKPETVAVPAPPAPPPPPPKPPAPKEIDWMVEITPDKVPAAVRVSILTDKGEILVELNGKAAPITVANFLRYVESGKLTGSEFWRATQYSGNGFIQASMRGPTFPPIPHEPTSKTGLTHTSGTLSMSRFAPGTATADFVICVGDNTSMDAGREGSEDKLGYAAFGRVVKGMSVVRAILGGKISKHTREGGWAGQMLATPVMVVEAKTVT